MLNRLPENIESFGASSFNQYDNLCIAEFLSKGARQPTPTFLSEHVIIFLLKGGKIMYSKGEKITVSSSHVILLKRGYYLMCERLVTNEPYHSQAFYFNEALLQDFWNKFYQVFEKSKSKNFNDVNVIPLAEPFEVLRDSLKYYLDYKGAHAEHLIKNRFEEFLLLLTEKEPTHPMIQFIANMFDTPDKQINQVVSENLFNPITVDDLAKLCGKSVSGFKREFKALYNMPPKQWVLQRRLEHSKTLLSSSDKTVKEIAHECGFESPSHFIRVYKKQFGTTPKGQVTQIANSLD